jgi:SnoaL-like protein
MDAPHALTELMDAIDERRWTDLGRYLHPDFVCKYVHTGESFDRDQWIRLNAEYPGFDHLLVQEIVGERDLAACRSHVTGVDENGLIHFECATFVRLDGGLIREMTEVWTGVGQSAPESARPTSTQES